MSDKPVRDYLGWYASPHQLRAVGRPRNTITNTVKILELRTLIAIASPPNLCGFDSNTPCCPPHFSPCSRRNQSYTSYTNCADSTSQTIDIGGLAMKRQLVLGCSTGYKLVCKKDSEKKKYQCCCCSRPGSEVCENDPYVELDV